MSKRTGKKRKRKGSIGKRKTAPAASSGVAPDTDVGETGPSTTGAEPDPPDSRDADAQSSAGEPLTAQEGTDQQTDSGGGATGVVTTDDDTDGIARVSDTEAGEATEAPPSADREAPSGQVADTTDRPAEVGHRDEEIAKLRAELDKKEQELKGALREVANKNAQLANSEKRMRDLSKEVDRRARMAAEDTEAVVRAAAEEALHKTRDKAKTKIQRLKDQVRLLNRRVEAEMAARTAREKDFAAQLEAKAQEAARAAEQIARESGEEATSLARKRARLELKRATGEIVRLRATLEELEHDQTPTEARKEGASESESKVMQQAVVDAEETAQSATEALAEIEARADREIRQAREEVERLQAELADTVDARLALAEAHKVRVALAESYHEMAKLQEEINKEKRARKTAEAALAMGTSSRSEQPVDADTGQPVSASVVKPERTGTWPSIPTVKTEPSKPSAGDDQPARPGRAKGNAGKGGADDREVPIARPVQPPPRTGTDPVIPTMPVPPPPKPARPPRPAFVSSTQLIGGDRTAVWREDTKQVVEVVKHDTHESPKPVMRHAVRPEDLDSDPALKRSAGVEDDSFDPNEWEDLADLD
ncbi:hypothetical protein ACFL59_06475 [Planctomycetota bacterium]